MDTPTVEVEVTARELGALVAYQPRFKSSLAVGNAAATVQAASSAGSLVGTATEGPTSYLAVAPGLLQLGTVDLARSQRRSEHAVKLHGIVQEQIAAARVEGESRDAQWALWNAGVLDLDDFPVYDSTEFEPVYDPLDRGEPTREVTVWSRKSRSNMVRRFSTLDYEPLVAQGVPAMATLTLPDEWQRHAPSGREFKRLVAKWQKAYRRAWGRPLIALWKLEFQRRGAPHLHMLLVPQHGADRVHGLPWGEWYARAWADALGLPEGQERDAVLAVHSHYSAHSDFAEGLRASDPKRIAVYFLKHNVAGDKEYQHDVPAEWQEPGAGPGRFWGYWKLEPVVVVVPISYRERIDLHRCLRRYASAEQGTRKAAVVRHRVNVQTGEIVARRRWAHRRVKRLGSPEGLPTGRGYLVVNDGAAVALGIASVLDPPKRPISVRALMLADLRRHRCASGATS